MRRTLLVAIALLVISADADGASLRLPAFAGCLDTPQTRPSDVQLACGDGNFFLTQVKWSSWTDASAAGLATGHQNDCKPFCAAGHFHLYRVAVRVFRPETCRNGARKFTRVTFSFVSTRPAGVARSGTFKSPFYLGRGCP